MSQIVVSCETPIHWEQFSLVYITNTYSIWYFAQFVHNAIFMSLHGPAGACIHVPPIQHVLKHCGGTHIYYIHARDQNNLRIPELAGFACQLGCKKRRLKFMCIFNELRFILSSPLHFRKPLGLE